MGRGTHNARDILLTGRRNSIGILGVSPDSLESEGNMFGVDFSEIYERVNPIWSNDNNVVPLDTTQFLAKNYLIEMNRKVTDYYRETAPFGVVAFQDGKTSYFANMEKMVVSTKTVPVKERKTIFPWEDPDNVGSVQFHIDDDKTDYLFKAVLSNEFVAEENQPIQFRRAQEFGAKKKPSLEFYPVLSDEKRIGWKPDLEAGPDEIYRQGLERAQSFTVSRYDAWVAEAATQAKQARWFYNTRYSLVLLVSGRNNVLAALSVNELGI